MSWKARNIGEFYCVGLAIYTIELKNFEKQKMNMHLGNYIEGDTYIFESADGGVKFGLAWFNENQELWGAMTIYNPTTLECKTYKGFEELSLPEPSLYLACIFNRCFELHNNAKFIGTASRIKD